MKTFYVHIKDTKTDALVKTLGPFEERVADKIDDGVNINLDHNHYHTEIDELSAEETLRG